MREYRNRICSAVLAAVCVIGTALIPSRAVHAEDVVDPIAVQKQAAYDAVPETNGLENWPQGPHVYANSAIVMEMNSGAILYGKKINDKHYPASITKLLTALVALENADPDDEVYFSEDSVSFLEYGDASIGMRPGEILSMNDALYGMLLASANEVSYAIAESVGKKMGGGFETFIQKMNERCEELGCTGSHWTNANGLHDENHYTTAHDMALIGSAVYQFDKFREVTQTLNYTIPPTNLVNESRTFQQNHKMLWVGAHYSYDYCTGGKTGYTIRQKRLL
ncbi:D-alanyl-D-alanine carboxypeptidase family protein [[Ruminococcus] torques]|uniref:D-alanyl-D-alanine carboxypeptidase family protein n=1 Tax=[Ruminococcus] torques TaxID=33039 RepID=UPI00402B038E